MQPELHVNPHIYRRPFPDFGRPKVIGYIGFENVKYARLVEDKNVNFDLNLHLDKVIRKPQDLDVKYLYANLLQFLLENEHQLNFPLERILDKARFYCFRGLLTYIACTPYENQEPWKLVATLHKGNIYLCMRDTDIQREKKKNMTETDKRFTSWGYKFEQYMLSDTPTSDPNPDVPVDENEEFSLVFTTHLNRHKLVYGAEMDGIRCDKNPAHPPSTDADRNDIIKYLTTKEYVEMKTSRHIQFSKQERNFRRFKTKKWWCQSFIAGVETIVCGFRNDAGIVEELKVYKVGELAKMSSNFWDSSVCLNFLDTFLTYVKRCLAREIRRKYGDKAVNNLQELPLISIMFEWAPGMPVRVNEEYVYNDDPILPEWFVDNYARTNQM